MPFARSLPADKALHADTLLAIRMSGQLLQRVALLRGSTRRDSGSRWEHLPSRAHPHLRRQWCLAAAYLIPEIRGYSGVVLNLRASTGARKSHGSGSAAERFLPRRARQSQGHL